MTDPRSVLSADQERSFVRLLFDARHLAQSRISTVGRFSAFCFTCEQHVNPEDPSSGHTETCLVGTVLRDTLQLQKALPVSTLPAPDRATGVGAFSSGQFGEPWRQTTGEDDETGTRTVVEAAAGMEVADLAFSECLAEDEERLAQRIVACVNFCAVIPTEVLERASAGAHREFVRQQLAADPVLRGQDAVFGTPEGLPSAADLDAVEAEKATAGRVRSCAWPVCACSEENRCLETYPQFAAASGCVPVAAEKGGRQ
jgi:hypothetical protein